MSEEKKYVDILNKARRKRKWNIYKNYILGAAGVLLLIGAAVILFRFASAPGDGNGDPAPANAAAEGGENTEESTQSAEEAAAEKARLEQQEKEAVVASYGNLGLVQLQDGGYLNIRQTPTDESMANIIGKMPDGSACEILGEEEGGWLKIRSGGIEGYISGQYVLTGEEARQKAAEYVTLMAIARTEKPDGAVNIRQSPDTSSQANIVGQALNGERYPVISQQDGWVQIAEGYMSSDYLDVRMALDEGRKLDLKTMALNQYENLLISKVENYLNIRSTPEEDSYGENIIGKLPSNAAGDILETLDGWYKIKSGNITGYVSAEHVAVGQEAKDLALQNASLTAIVNTDMLNVRSEPNTESKIWTQISKSERYHVLNQLDGWVEIELDTGDSGDEENSDDKAYISTENNYVEVRYTLPEAIKFSPLEERANQQASLRNKVVNYALQFVGGRYVWGGNDPHTGADCSGFVKYVLSHMAGVGLPRTSRDQAKVGRSVSSSEMRPGDLIFYTNSRGVVNHVAMYIGNGQIVHAASRRSGIKISTWNYRKPKAIRSVLD